MIVYLFVKQPNHFILLGAHCFVVVVVVVFVDF